MAQLKGLITATLTPFVSSVGPVDYEWIPAHLRFLEAAGVQGIVPMGTTGEGLSLGLAERQRLMDIVMAHRGDMFVIAATGSASLADTIALSNYALEQGADALLIVPPFFFKRISDAGLYEYYRALCDSLPQDAKLVLYHIPQYSGVPITTRVIDDLLETNASQIIGIKDSAGDLEHLTGLITRYPQLAIYGGSDDLAAETLLRGGSGVISGLANVFPRLLKAVFEAHERSDDPSAAQQRVQSVRTLTRSLPLQATLKAMLPWTSDLSATAVRSPLVALSDDEQIALRQSLADLGEINA